MIKQWMFFSLSLTTHSWTCAQGSLLHTLQLFFSFYVLLNIYKHNQYSNHEYKYPKEKRKEKKSILFRVIQESVYL